jgi:hypothetical protein
MQTMRLERGCLQPTQSQFSIASQHRSGAHLLSEIYLQKLPVFAEPRLPDDSANTPFARHVNSEANLTAYYVWAAFF